MFPDMSGLVSLFKLMAILLCVTIPLGLWKLTEIAIWIYGHVNVNWN